MHNSFSTIKLGSKIIGDGHPIYIMADLGLTNGGDLDRSLKLIDKAAELGVDAVKFQMIEPEKLLGDKLAEYTYQTLKNGLKTETYHNMFSKLSYSESEWKTIADYAKSKKLEFICTAHVIEAVAVLERVGVNIHKICTWSMNHKRLVQEIGKTKKPLMLDTGMFTTSTLLRTLNWHIECGGLGVIILHDFHTLNTSQMNFRAIPFMKKKFGYPVGYTPQGRDRDMDFMSIGLGVNVLEKRLTLDRSIPENGHFKSLEPNEFSLWIKCVKELESSLGFYSVLPTDDDMKISKIGFKSLYLNQDIEKNEIISNVMISAKRPGDGILADKIDDVCGRTARHNIKKGTKLKWEDFY